MNIKTYAKINIWIIQIITFIMRMVLFFSIIIIIIMLPIVIFANPSTEQFLFLSSCICYLAISAIILDLINKHFNIIHRFLNVPNDKKIILSIILTRTHNSTQLNSELDKLSKAIENKSSSYLNTKDFIMDFPLLTKLFFRFEQVNQKQSNKLKGLTFT